MIENNINQNERLEKLNETARKELNILSSDNNIIGIEKLDNNKRLMKKSQLNNTHFIDYKYVK